MNRQKPYIEASANTGANARYNMHIEAATSEGVAQFKLVDRIAEYSEASAESVRTLAEQFTAQGLKKAHVFISSRGGDALQAADIAIELKTKFDEVTITIGAIAASAVTRIMVEFDDVRAYPNSQFMIHRPKMGTYGDEKEVEANLKALKNATADYKSAYAKRFGKSEDEIEKLWANGDYWMNAKEAREMGLISEILTDNQYLNAEDVAVLEACGAPTIPKVKPKSKMDLNEMRSALGLDASATEEQMLAAAKKATERAGAADQLEADASKNAKVRAEGMVDQAIRDKKISAEKRDNWVALATADYDNTKASIEAMQSVPKLSAELNPGERSDENRDSWNLEAWLEKDPEGLNAMAESDPEKFKKINSL